MTTTAPRYRVTKRHTAGLLAGTDTTETTTVEFRVHERITDAVGGGAYTITAVRKVCLHGLTGFCCEEATPEQRAALDTLHRHAYAWAADHLDGDLDPERYAAAYAEAHYALPDTEWVSHPAFAEGWNAAA